MKKAIILFIAATAAMMSCSTDLEVIGDYEDYTVVYGILSENETTHKFKITKAFLGEANAYEMAKEEDSNYYKYDEVDVYLEEWHDGSFISSIKLDTGFIHNKEEGTFYAPTQRVYENKTPQNLDPQSEYKLIIKNHKSQEETSAELNIVTGGIISEPWAGLINPQRNLDMRMNNGHIEWHSFTNASLYYAKIRFNYVEVIDGDSTEHFIDWQLGSKMHSSNGYDSQRINYIKNDIYNKIAENLEADESIERLPGKINHHENQLVFIITAFDNTYYTYQELSSNDDNVFSIRPEYSNIENGIGLVYSKNSISEYFQFGPDALDTLIIGPRTKALNFNRW